MSPSKLLVMTGLSPLFHLLWFCCNCHQLPPPQTNEPPKSPSAKRAVMSTNQTSDSQAAVVRGAAIRGLEGTMPRTLICRRHYGLKGGLPFRPGIDDEKHAYISWGDTYCSGRMDWLVQKVRRPMFSNYGPQLAPSSISFRILQNHW